MGLVDTGQFVDAAGGVPVLDVEVAVFVVAESVGSGEDADGDVFDLGFESGPLFFDWVVAEEGNGSAGLVENGDASLKFGYSAVVAPNANGAWAA